MSDTIVKEEIIGARNKNNIFISLILFFAGLGFFLTGLSTYFHINLF